MKKVQTKYNMQKNTLFSKRDRTDSDEYYTARHTVEEILSMIKPEFLHGKIIYCPCDSDESYFVICLKEQKDKFKYKQLIYTSDDFRTHGDLFDKSDFVITNPPFSLTAEFCRTLNKYNPDFLFITFSTGFKTALMNNLKCDFINTRHIKNPFINGKNSRVWEKQDCTIPVLCSNENFTTFKRDQLRYFRTFDDIKDQVFYYENFVIDEKPVLNIDYVYDVPIDYEGYFGLPITAPRSKYCLIKNIDFITIIKKPVINGKSRFGRILCKWKDIDKNKEIISQFTSNR